MKKMKEQMKLKKETRNKNKNRRRDKNGVNLGFLALLFMLTGALLFSSGQTVQAASKATSKKAAALKAYNTFLQKTSYKVYTRYSVPFSKASFGLAYLNNDSVPELIVKDNVDRSYKDYRLIFTYKNGKVKLLNHDIFSKYYKKTRVYMRVIKLSTNQTGLREVQHNKLIGKQSKCYLKRQKGTIIYGEKINRYCDANMKDITPAEYNQRLKKLTKSKKASSVKYYKNSAANRRKHLK